MRRIHQSLSSHHLCTSLVSKLPRLIPATHLLVPLYYPQTSFLKATRLSTSTFEIMAPGNASTHSSTEPFLVRFYDPEIKARDPPGRTFSDIFSWKDDKLEFCHNYIQILFPLPEGSPYNPAAPIIDRATFDAFRSRQELRDMLKLMLVRILRFYGFNYQHDTHTSQPEILPGHNYAQASRNWVMKFNHNHLRITRIIRSLRVLGLQSEADLFFQALVKVYEDSAKISERSLMYWTRAAKRPLYLAPEDEEDEGHGVDFLYEFEASKVGAEEKSGEHDEEEEEEWEGIKDEEEAAAETGLPVGKLKPNGKTELKRKSAAKVNTPLVVVHEAPLETEFMQDS